MIIISEYIEPSALRWLSQREACLYDPELYQNPNKLKSLLIDARGLIVRNRTKVVEDCLQHAQSLQVVGRLGVGLDNLDCEALSKRSVTTVFAPGASGHSVAEFCLLLMLAHAKQLLAADPSVRQGKWDRSGLMGSELRGKVVGVLGFGAVGKPLAAFCGALGCHVLVHSRRKQNRYEDVTLDELLLRSDFVCLCLPLTEDTKELIGQKELRMMKNSAYLINAARGEIVDEEALYKALVNGDIAGASLDVRQLEPPHAGDPFYQLNNVILSPHVAGLTMEAQEAVCQMVVEDVWRVLNDELPLNAVKGLNFVRRQQATGSRD